MIYKFSERFTSTPGGRFKEDGDFSGEEFREDVLIELYENAVKKREKIIIDLDDTYGYPSSFLEEAFGGLARSKGTREVLKYLEIKSDDDPTQIKRIEEYIKKAGENK